MFDKIVAFSKNKIKCNYKKFLSSINCDYKNENRMIGMMKLTGFEHVLYIHLWLEQSLLENWVSATEGCDDPIPSQILSDFQGICRRI